ncbi:hypothetical protein C0J52_04559 [Blattella germanica]|nr:hypothetical protein C0J52_04559 [Blattella germanica]
MYPSRAHSWRAPQSILKNSHQTCRSKHSAVHFPAEESQIIGFGGGECFSSDGEDITEQEDSAAGSDGEEGEEEQALQRLTRTNTDFNTNLSHSGLQLGKPVTDSEGKRKTLLVSVTPYSLPHQNSKDILLKSLSKCDEIIQDDCKISEVQTESNIDPDSQKQEGMNFLLDKSKDLENVSLVTKSQQNEAIVFDSTDESVKPRESKSDDEVINTKISDTGTSHISIYSKEICKDKCQELEIPASTVLDNEKCTDSSKHKEILPDLISNGEKRRESARIQDISSNFPSNRENLNDIPKLPETSSGINKETCRDTAKLLTLSPPLMSNKDKFKDIPKLTESINNTTFSKGKFRDLKQINIEPVSRFGMKTTMESRIPIIKTRPKPAVRKSYDLVKKNDIFVKKVPDLIHKSTEQNLNLAPQKKDSDENIVQVNNISESIIQVNISKTDNSKKETSTSEPLIEGESKEAHPKECEDMFSMEESRELAGEPDGRADPDEPGEPPALPRSPPPIIDPRPSFLHTLVKPKIPAKPITKLLQTTPRRIIPSREDIQVPETDAARVPKRQAPKPPPVPIEEVPCSTFLSKAATKETTCSYEVSSECPEPAPRKSLSVSVESLSTPEPEKKKSSSGKARFSLRKLLRLGASREEKIGSCEVSQTEEVPIPRPRLEIIHPSELNGSNVEVLGRIMDETETGRPAKPPPPPRNQSLAIEGFNRPARPPPPKSAELLRQQKQVKDELPTTAQSCGNLYANLGE